MDEIIINSRESDTNSEERFSLNDKEPMNKNISLTKTFEAVVGVNSDQIDFNNEDDGNGIILSIGGTIDPGNAKDTTNAGLNTKINTVAAEELEKDKVVLENKEDRQQVGVFSDFWAKPCNGYCYLNSANKALILILDFIAKHRRNNINNID